MKDNLSPEVSALLGKRAEFKSRLAILADLPDDTYMSVALGVVGLSSEPRGYELQLNSHNVDRIRAIMVDQIETDLSAVERSLAGRSYKSA